MKIHARLIQSWPAKQSHRSWIPFFCKADCQTGSNVYDTGNSRIHHWNTGEYVHWIDKLLWLGQEPENHLRQLHPDLLGSFQNQLSACGVYWCSHTTSRSSCLSFLQSNTMFWHIMGCDWSTVYMVCHLPQHFLLPQNCPLLSPTFPLVEVENENCGCCFSCIFFVLTDFLFSTAWNTSYFEGNSHDHWKQSDFISRHN